MSSSVPELPELAIYQKHLSDVITPSLEIEFFLFASFGSLAMLLAGVSGHVLNGFIDRLNPDDDRYLASISPNNQGTICTHAI